MKNSLADARNTQRSVNSTRRIHDLEIDSKTTLERLKQAEDDCQLEMNRLIGKDRQKSRIAEYLHMLLNNWMYIRGQLDQAKAVQWVAAIKNLK